MSTFEPPHDKTNKMTCAPSKDSDQPGRSSFCSLTFCLLFQRRSAIFECVTPLRSLISRLMRLWQLSPSVNSVFKHACAAIHWGYTSDICQTIHLLPYFSPEPSLFAYAISTVISWAGSFHLIRMETLFAPWKIGWLFIYFWVQRNRNLFLVPTYMKHAHQLLLMQHLLEGEWGFSLITTL